MLSFPNVSISYRLNQISKIFGVDLKDCGVITELYLAMFAEIIKAVG